MPCSERCTHAKGDLCRCSCGGANHGIYADKEEEKPKRLDGRIESECIKCGSMLYYTERFEPFYCNKYCCNPCCPDHITTPCLKERWEDLQTGIYKQLGEKDWSKTNQIISYLIANEANPEDYTPEESINEYNKIRGDYVMDYQFKKKHKDFLENKKARRAEIERNKPGLQDAKARVGKLKEKKQYRRMKDSTFRREQKEKLPQLKITDFEEIKNVNESKD